MAVLTFLAACDRPAGPPGPALTPTVAGMPTPPAAGATLSAAPATRPDLYAPSDLLTFPARVQADGEFPLLIALRFTSAAWTGRPPSSPSATPTASTKSSRPLGVDLRLLQVAGTGGPDPSPLAPGDLVRCGVEGLSVGPAKARVVIVRVGADGGLRVPFVSPVPVAGLTDAAAAAAVSDAFRRANVLSNAVVSVLTLEKAPPDAAHLKMPDGPLLPVPEPLRHLYVTP